MLQSRRPSSSLRPRCPFKEAAAAEAAWSARQPRRKQRRRARPERSSVGAQPCPAPGELARSGAPAGDTPRPAQAGGPESLSRRLPVRFPVSFRSFLSNTFAPPPRPPSSASPPFSAPRRGRHSHREGASDCRAPGSSPGNFWTRWWCPLGKGEERSPGRRERAANQGAAGGGGAGSGRGDSGRPGHPGSRSCGHWGGRADGTPGGAGRAAGAASWWGREGGRDRAAQERLDLGCDSLRLGKRGMAVPRHFPGA